MSVDGANVEQMAQLDLPFQNCCLVFPTPLNAAAVTLNGVEVAMVTSK